MLHLMRSKQVKDLEMDDIGKVIKFNDFGGTRIIGILSGYSIPRDNHAAVYIACDKFVFHEDDWIVII